MIVADRLIMDEGWLKADMYVRYQRVMALCISFLFYEAFARVA